MFTVAVVDETGKPVANVGLVLVSRVCRETRKTDGSGIVKYEASNVDSVKVKFESPKAPAKAMEPVWESRPATPADEYLPPSEDALAVMSRPAAVETLDGKPFTWL